MSIDKPLLTQALASSSCSSSWGQPEWSLLIRQARRANLLNRLASQTFKDIPERAEQHFINAKMVANANARSVKLEVLDIQRVLAEENISFMLLKGAAYLYAGFEFGKTRVYSDVDILVERSQLDLAEKLFIQNGWMTTKLNAYDQKYYRQWMHELPPLKHLKRQSSLDVHHTIVPPTSVYDLDIGKLWQESVPVEGVKNVFVPSNIDMLLHSSVHLFSDGDFENGIRDLSDIACMVSEFKHDEGFWDKLEKRAEELGLIEPVFYALRYGQFYLDIDVSHDVISQFQYKAGCSAFKLRWMDWLFKRGLLPNHESCTDKFREVAMFILFVRSHYLRMPLTLLIPHLLRKAVYKEEDR